jgi:E3 ubiquitin-protein ligase EDD1
LILSYVKGGETYDLVPDGSIKDVTFTNLYEFIKRYAEFRMIHLVEQSLQVCVAFVFIICLCQSTNELHLFKHLRLGVFDVLPSTALDYLSAEDFRLLLNGTDTINITTLMTYTTFNDESGQFQSR